MAETFKGLVQITHKDGRPTTVKIGGDSGTLDLYSREDQSTPTVRIHGKDGTLDLGNEKLDGDLKIFSKTSEQPSTIRFRVSGDTGELTILDKAGKTRFSFSSDKAELLIKAPNGTNVAAIDGAGNLKLNGDIVLRSAGAAEDFESADAADVPLGSVMVLTDDGRVRASTEPYDKRVAGVLCGAPDSRPGLVLGRPAGADIRRLPIALIGKTVCLADATSVPIKVGDLLTTSATDGHAMRASDATKALGATIGKALRPLERGKALVPILVTLQ